MWILAVVKVKPNYVNLTMVKPNYVNLREDERKKFSRRRSMARCEGLKDDSWRAWGGNRRLRKIKRRNTERQRRRLHRSGVPNLRGQMVPRRTTTVRKRQMIVSLKLQRVVWILLNLRFLSSFQWLTLLEKIGRTWMREVEMQTTEEKRKRWSRRRVEELIGLLEIIITPDH